MGARSGTLLGVEVDGDAGDIIAAS
jgi:hypothetical protein